MARDSGKPRTEAEWAQWQRDQSLPKSKPESTPEQKAKDVKRHTDRRMQGVKLASVTPMPKQQSAPAQTPRTSGDGAMGSSERAVIELFERLDPEGMNAVAREQARCMARILDDPEKVGGHAAAVKAQNAAIAVLGSPKRKSRRGSPLNRVSQMSGIRREA